jgi:hypothetical protein
METNKSDNTNTTEGNGGAILTLEALKNMKPKEVFSFGTVENSPKGIYMTSEHIGRKLLWVAKRGEIHDWDIL